MRTILYTSIYPGTTLKCELGIYTDLDGHSSSLIQWWKSDTTEIYGIPDQSGSSLPLDSSHIGYTITATVKVTDVYQNVEIFLIRSVRDDDSNEYPPKLSILVVDPIKFTQNGTTTTKGRNGTNPQTDVLTIAAKNNFSLKKSTYDGVDVINFGDCSFKWKIQYSNDAVIIQSVMVQTQKNPYLSLTATLFETLKNSGCYENYGSLLITGYIVFNGRAFELSPTTIIQDYANLIISDQYGNDLNTESVISIGMELRIFLENPKITTTWKIDGMVVVSPPSINSLLLVEGDLGKRLTLCINTETMSAETRSEYNYNFMTTICIVEEKQFHIGIRPTVDEDGFVGGHGQCYLYDSENKTYKTNTNTGLTIYFDYKYCRGVQLVDLEARLVDCESFGATLPDGWVLGTINKLTTVEVESKYQLFDFLKREPIEDPKNFVGAVWWFKKTDETIDTFCPILDCPCYLRTPSRSTPMKFPKRQLF